MTFWAAVEAELTRERDAYEDLLCWEYSEELE